MCVQECCVTQTRWDVFVCVPFRDVLFSLKDIKKWAVLHRVYVCVCLFDVCVCVLCNACSVKRAKRILVFPKLQTVSTLPFLSCKPIPTIIVRSLLYLKRLLPPIDLHVFHSRHMEELSGNDSADSASSIPEFPFGD